MGAARGLERALAVALTLFCLGCEPELSVEFWVVGDSIAAEDLEEISLFAFPLGYQPIPSAQGGIALQAELDFWLERLPSLASRSAPDVILVSLLTNGRGWIWGDNHLAAFFALAEATSAFLDALPPDFPVVWLTLPSSGALDPDRGAAANFALYCASSGRSNVTLLDTEAFLASCGECLRDGVHYTPEGQLAMAAWLLDQVAAIAGP